MIHGDEVLLRRERVDDGVLAVLAIKHSAREGRALTAEQLYELASWFPECAKRMGYWQEQLLARARGASLVFPTPTGKQWTESGFRERVWSKAVAAAVANDPAGERSIFKGFNFHLHRHTACSLIATAGMDPAVAAERAGDSDGGALFLRRYRHLYEAEKRTQARLLEAFIRASLDGSGQTIR